MSDGNTSASFPLPHSAPRGSSAFQVLHLGQVRDDLLALYERIACEYGRVEIHNGNGSCACVLISKAELDSLEEAIAKLSDGDGVKAMCDTLARFALVVE